MGNLCLERSASLACSNGFFRPRCLEQQVPALPVPPSSVTGMTHCRNRLTTSDADGHSHPNLALLANTSPDTRQRPKPIPRWKR